jgi:hypothetical protein
MIIKDETASSNQLAIVERYEAVIHYLYPILQSCPRKHGVVRDLMVRTLFQQVDLLIVAGKSGQPSRLYAADANLATLRFWLRFAACSKLKVLTPHQHQVALTLIAEVGSMLGAWIRTAKSRG